MSTTPKKKSAKGMRYTDAQKQEVVDFVSSYNTTNGRGGQSKASEKFNVSQLTIAGWIKGKGSKPAAKVAKAPKPAAVAKPAKSAGASKVGTRYTPEQKKEVVDFAVEYNAANGRGGQSKAADKFGVSPLTVMAWLKNAGASKPARKSDVKPVKVAKAAKAVKGAKRSSGDDFDTKLSSLQALRKEIARAESELAKLNSRFDSLKSSL